MDAITRQYCENFLRILSNVSLDELKRPLFFEDAKTTANMLNGSEIYKLTACRIDLAQRCAQSSEFGSALFEIQLLVSDIQGFLESKQSA